MSKRLAPWLLMLMLALQALAVAAETHQFVQPSSDELAAQFVTEAGSDEAITPNSNTAGPDSGEHHCPFCCQCYSYVVPSFPAAEALRISSFLPSYRISIHSNHPLMLFRPPKIA